MKIHITNKINAIKISEVANGDLFRFTHNNELYVKTSSDEYWTYYVSLRDGTRTSCHNSTQAIPATSITVTFN